VGKCSSAWPATKRLRCARPSQSKLTAKTTPDARGAAETGRATTTRLDNQDRYRRPARSPARKRTAFSECPPGRGWCAKRSRLSVDCREDASSVEERQPPGKGAGSLVSTACAVGSHRTCEIA